MLVSRMCTHTHLFSVSWVSLFVFITYETSLWPLRKHVWHQVCRHFCKDKHESGSLEARAVYKNNKKAVLSQRCLRNAPWHFWQICTIWQYTHGSLLESPFVPSSTDCWAVRAKIRQKRPSQESRGETGSRNMVATQKNQNSAGDFL